jgi:hypothetical protein
MRTRLRARYYLCVCPAIHQPDAAQVVQTVQAHPLKTAFSNESLVYCSSEELSLHQQSIASFGLFCSFWIKSEEGRLFCLSD